MIQKKLLGFWDIWNMSFGFLGIQFGFALQGGFMTRIFQTLGASKDEIPLLWIAAPLTGLIVQPIVGYMSDRTWSVRWGRRRPYFLVGLFLVQLHYFLFPTLNIYGWQRDVYGFWMHLLIFLWNHSEL